MEDEYLGSAEAIQYLAAVSTFYPIGRWEEEPLRVNSEAFWHLSWNELRRRILRMEKVIGKDELYKKVCEIAESYAIDIIDALISAYDLTLQYSNWDFDQGLSYFQAHKTSTSPFEDEVRGRNWKYKEILDHPEIARQAWNLMRDWDIVNIPILRDWLTKQESAFRSTGHGFRHFIDPVYSYKSLRNRPSKATLIQQTNNHALYRCTSYRSRSTTGVKGLSQEECGIYKTEVKNIVYAPLNSIVRRLSGASEYHLTDEEGVGYYLSMPKDLTCLDVNNAEQQIGNALYYLPYNIDFHANDLPVKYGSSLASGIGKTRWVNNIFTALIYRAMKELGIVAHLPAEAWGGGDNMGTLLKFSDPKRISAMLDFDDRNLGYNPKLQRFYGQAFTVDNKDKMEGVARVGDLDGLVLHQEKQRVDRTLMGVIQRDYYQEGDCRHFLEVVKDMDAARSVLRLEPLDVVQHEFLEAWIAENPMALSRIMSEFSNQRAWVESIYPIYNGQSSSDGYYVINGRKVGFK